MLQPPNRREVLTRGPWVAAAAGALCGYLAWPAFGAGAAWILGGVMAVVLGGLAVALLYRSVHGPVHGLLAGLALELLATTLCAVVAAAALAMAEARALVPSVVAAAGITQIIVTLWSLGTTLAALRREGPEGPWARGALDLKRGRIRTSTAADDAAQTLDARRWAVAALIVNAPWLAQVGSLPERWFAGVAGLAAIVGAAWLNAAFVGPLLARAHFVRRIERVRGIRLVHEGYEDLQALRRTVWLARLVMRDPSG